MALHPTFVHKHVYGRILVDKWIERATVSSIWDPKHRVQLAAICLASVANGFNDAGAGIVIPHMQTYYNNGSAEISAIFVGQALGSFYGLALFKDIRARFESAQVLLGLANMITLAGYVPMITASPYISILFAFCIISFGAATNMAFGIRFCGDFRGGIAATRLLHGCYGVGGAMSSLIAMHLLERGATCSQLYLVHAGFAACVLLFNMWSFKSAGKEHTLNNADRAEIQLEKPNYNGVLLTMPTKVVLLGAIFGFAFSGVQTSMSGWSVSILCYTYDSLKYRSAGLALVAFWVGLTVGCFTPPGKPQSWGEKPLVLGATIAAVVCQFLAWLVLDAAVSIIITALIGVMLGSVYPCMFAVLLRHVPEDESVGEMMIAFSAFGSLGGAAAPLLVGLLSEPLGMSVMHPICLILYAMMLSTWLGMPDNAREEV